MFVASEEVHFVLLILTFLIRFLDASARWSVVTGNGQANGRTIVELDRLLHQSFTERASADDGTTVVVLNGSGKDFAGRCRTFVQENDERHLLATARTIRRIVFAWGLPSFCVNNEASFRKEFVDHLNGWAHVSAGISAQVDDDTLAVVLM